MPELEQQESHLVDPAETERKRLEALEEVAQSTDPIDLVAAALVLWDQGVYERALPLYEKLAKQMPAEPVVQAFLADPYGKAGRVEEARQTRELAEKLGFSLTGDEGDK